MWTVLRLFLLAALLATIYGCEAKPGAHAVPAPLRTESLEIGTPKGDFLNIVEKLHARDITPGLAIEGQNGEHPLHGIVWEFPGFGAVVSVQFDENNQIDYLDYCSTEDFSVSKMHRARTTVKVSRITFMPDGRDIEVKLSQQGA